MARRPELACPAGVAPGKSHGLGSLRGDDDRVAGLGSPGGELVHEVAEGSGKGQGVSPDLDVGAAVAVGDVGGPDLHDGCGCESEQQHQCAGDPDVQRVAGVVQRDVQQIAAAAIV